MTSSIGARCWRVPAAFSWTIAAPSSEATNCPSFDPWQLDSVVHGPPTSGSQSLTTKTVVARQYFHRRLSVYPSVYPHDISKSDAATITKLGIQKCSTMSRGNSFNWGQKIQVQGHEPQNQCWRESLHSCECWLLLRSTK